MCIRDRAYRIKGTVNEMNVGSIIEGEPVIIRSRVDENQVWKGTMGSVDRESTNSQSSSNAWGMMDASGDSQTSSTTYPFYVELQSSEGLMLGQHVYIEPDEMCIRDRPFILHGNVVLTISIWI